MTADWPFYISIAVCAVLFTVVVATFATLAPKDSSQNTKLLTIVGAFSFASSFVAYALALYHFSHNPTYMIQFILAIVMLVILPACLMSAGVSTITISNLRDSLAAGNQSGT
jgi:hypothetical protein